MKRKILLFLAALALAFAFSGCGTFEIDTEALMTPPSLTEEQTKLHFALSQVIGENYHLKYPSGDVASSAFMFSDLDGDGTEEALAFYSLDDENTRINILRKQGSDWISIYEAAGSSGDIQSVRFVELDRENLLVVQWNQEAGVYRFVGDRLETLYSSLCDGIDIADLSGDGYGDILIFSNAFNGRSNLRIIYGDNGEMLVTEGVDLNAEYGMVYSTAVGDVGDGKIGYFIDAKLHDNIYLTEIITLEKEKARRYTIADLIPYEPEEEPENSGGITLITRYGPRGIYTRNTPAKCLDLNGDGIIEFPVEIREDAASQENKNYFYLQYMRFNGENSDPVWSGFVDPEEGFGFKLPESWAENVGISYNEAYGEYRFTAKESTTEVLRLRVAPKNEYQDRFEEDYVLLGENQTKVFSAFVPINADEPFYLDPSALKTRFSFIGS